MEPSIGAQRKHSFRTRSFVAAAMIVTALALIPSGIANHLLAFDPFTSARHVWMTVHNVAGIVLCLFASWHIVLNWKALLNHIRTMRAQQLQVQWEAVAGGLLALAIITSVTMHAFP